MQDPGPYVVNFSAEAHHERVPAEEEAEVQAAALAAARDLAWTVEQAFEMAP